MGGVCTDLVAIFQVAQKSSQLISVRRHYHANPVKIKIKSRICFFIDSQRKACFSIMVRDSLERSGARRKHAQSAQFCPVQQPRGLKLSLLANCTPPTFPYSILKNNDEKFLQKIQKILRYKKYNHTFNHTCGLKKTSTRTAGFSHKPTKVALNFPGNIHLHLYKSNVYNFWQQIESHV